MQTIERRRTIEAPPGDVREAITDVEPFMRAAGFDEVEVDDDRIDIAKALGLLKVSMTLRVVDEPDAVLAYEQVDGVFESMTTTYTFEDVAEGTAVTARTTFALDAPGGSLLDATVIKRQRRKELDAQFDYLEETVGR